MTSDVILVNLPIVHRTGDPFGNIPYMPTGVLYLAGFLRENGASVSILDGFGCAPRQVYRIDDNLSAVGLTEDEMVNRLAVSKIVGISVHAGMSHTLALRLAARIRAKYARVLLVAGGPHASVTCPELLEGAFDGVCVGEGERTLMALVERLRRGSRDLSGIPGLALPGAPQPLPVFEPNLDRLGFAALDLLPLEQYWDLRMSHAPVQGRYMAVTTSRGCPYACRFCTTPLLLGREWRTRSPKHVVDEIEKAVFEHRIEDVIIQDDVFGLQRETALELARELQRRQLRIRLSLPSGIKAERFDEEVLEELRRAGLQYVCVAPESGSERVLRNMNKPLDFEHLHRLVAFAHGLGIRMGAFFVLGFEDESDEDRELTRNEVIQLTRLGVDEVSLFIWTPLPGADAFESERGWARYEDLNWSPVWRAHYADYRRFRRNLYMTWLLTKMRYHPVALARSALNVATSRYELKCEMALRRVLSRCLP